MKTLSRIIFPVLMLLVMSISLKAQYVSNYVAYFNGTSGYVSFNKTPEIDLSNGYTIESWVYYQHTQGSMKTLFVLPGSGIALQISQSGNIHFSYNSSSTALLDAFPVDRWTHIAATYDGITAKIFLDGQEIYSINSPGLVTNTGDAGSVGAYRSGSNVLNYFKGYMNDFRLWTRAKSQFEINRDMYMSLANTTPTGVYSGLVISYKFDVYNIMFLDEGGFEANPGNNSSVTISPYGNFVSQWASYNSSLVLDGTTAYCVAPNFTKIHANSFITAESWFKVQNIAPRNEIQVILSKGNSTDYSYQIYLRNDSNLTFSVNTGTDYIIQTAVTKPFVWNHVAATFNAISGKMMIYLNGKLAASSDVTPAQIIASNSDSLYIGAAIGGGNKLKGQLDEVRIWGNTVRNADEIKQFTHQSINFNDQPVFNNVAVYGFDGRVSDVSTEPGSYPYTSLKFYGSAYMRSSKLQSELYSTSPVLWNAFSNNMDNTWNLSRANIDIPPSGVISDSIYYSTEGAVLDPKVLVMLNTSNIHAVKVKLIAPDGTTIQLTPDHSTASPKADLMTVFGDNGGQQIVYEENSLAPFSPYFKPNTLLSQLNGKDRKGWWKLKLEINNVGTESNLVKWGIQNNVVTEVTGNGEINLNSYKLDQNYPNPFNPSTNIKFELPANTSGLVKLSVYDITGREVAVLANGALKPGAYEYTWNAEAFSSGVYFYTLQTKGGLITKKMLLVK